MEWMRGSFFLFQHRNSKEMKSFSLMHYFISRFAHSFYSMSEYFDSSNKISHLFHSGSSWRFWLSCRNETQENVAENASEWRASRASSFGSSNRWFSIFVFPIAKILLWTKIRKKKLPSIFPQRLRFLLFFSLGVREFIRVKAKAMRYGVGWNGTKRRKKKNWTTKFFPIFQNLK